MESNGKFCFLNNYYTNRTILTREKLDSNSNEERTS